MTVFEKFEVVKSEPYKFIGRSVYIGNKAPGEHPENNKLLFAIHHALWEQLGWVFGELDKIAEYNSDEPHNAVLFTWDKYDDKNELYGYYIGRFMKADAPVPKGLDYFDITEEYIVKAWRKGKRGDIFGNCLIYAEEECKDEIGKTGLYKQGNNYLMAEIYPDPNEKGESYIGTFCPCVLINPTQR